MTTTLRQQILVFILAVIIIPIIVSFLIAFVKYVSYYYFYEDLVIETIIEYHNAIRP